MSSLSMYDAPVGQAFLKVLPREDRDLVFLGLSLQYTQEATLPLRSRASRGKLCAHIARRVSVPIMKLGEP